jgi:hypothetical protein
VAAPAPVPPRQGSGGDGGSSSSSSYLAPSVTSLSSGLGGYDNNGSVSITYTLRTIATSSSQDFG